MAQKKYFLSLAEKTGLAALLIAAPLILIAPVWAVSILFLFLASCMVAPFFPAVGFFLPVISRGKTGNHFIALTFDDGPSPASTPVLLQLLARYNLKATFFVIGQQAEQYPELIEQIVAAGHNVGNHSWCHDHLLMFRSVSTLNADIKQTQDVLAKDGIRPLAFRPPVGITGPRLRQVMDDQGLFTVNFSCRVFDRGNRNIKNLADRAYNRLKPGDILVLHDLFPKQTELGGYWQDQLDCFFRKLIQQYHVLPLDELIGRPVMEKVP